MAEPKKHLAVRLDAERSQRLNVYAEESGLKKQTILVRALDEYLDARPRQRGKKR